MFYSRRRKYSNAGQKHEVTNRTHGGELPTVEDSESLFGCDRDGVLELGINLFALSLVLISWETQPDQAINYPSWVGVLSWTYLLSLLALQRAPLVSISLKRHAWYHATCLYGLHWILTVMVVCCVTFQSGFPNLTSPLASGLEVTTYLLYYALWTPISVVATERDQAASHGQERSANLFELATFSWLDPLIWMGYRKRLEKEDVLQLANKETSRSILHAFHLNA